MDRKPVVSVIVPVLDNQEGVNALVEALWLQTWPRSSLEVIVVDNGSSSITHIDGRYSDFARVVKCGTPGAYAARNVGAMAANGAVFAFTDSDCVPDPTWLAAGVDELKRREYRSVVAGDVEFRVSNRPTAVERYQYLTGFCQHENVSRRGFSATANLFVTRSQFELVGAFDEAFLSGGDREWCWRAASMGVGVDYAEGARVITQPRKSLFSAIRQTRRVAGGRFMLRRKGSRHISPLGLEPHRGLLAAAKWILTHPNLSAAERAKVFGVASILKGAQTLETLRLRMGLRAERR